MLLGNNVLHVKRDEVHIVLMQTTVFAAPLSIFPNQCAKNRIHHSPEDLESSNRAFDFSKATKVPKLT